MRLGVNIDHIASIRQIRKGLEPDPLYAAFICEAAGADSIVVHLRQDRRHIKDRDLYLLKEALKTKLNLEMSLARQIVNIACRVKPEQATLVPERRKEVTTEGGLDVCANFRKIQQVANKLRSCRITVSLFIDPIKSQIEASSKLGIDMVELHTGSYAKAKTNSAKKARLAELQHAAEYASARGLRVFAGHDLDYYNVRPVAEIECIEELNIGYSIVCRAALVGLERAVRQMKDLIG